MSTMIDNLERLNRKERFFLIGMALGNQTFKLDPLFRHKLSGKFGVAIPGNAFVGIDYHLDWIFAAAALAFKKPANNSSNRVYENENLAIEGTQEDIDLLVGFEDLSGIVHLIMLEAKGVTPFNNRQFQHKLVRLKTIFGSNCEKFPRVKPYFGLVSPRKSRGLRYNECPSWLEAGDGIPWIEMPIPARRLRLERCNLQGEPSREGRFWTLREVLQRVVKQLPSATHKLPSVSKGPPSRAID